MVIEAVCNAVFGSAVWSVACTIIQLILGIVMCTLLAALFVRDSLREYRATRKLRLNRYVALLVREGLLYFLVYVLPSLALSSRQSELTQNDQHLFL